MYDNKSINEKIESKSFIEILKRYKLIVFGEIHGTKEIPKIIKVISKKINKNLGVVFFEIPKDQQKFLNKYLETKNDKDLYNVPFFRNPKKDGRDSKDILLLIRFIVENCPNVEKIICVDYEEKNRDFFMYKEIKNNFDLKNGKINIFITGNIHARFKKIKINEKEIIPCGHYLKSWLKDKMVSINFMANRGYFYNLGIKKVKNKKNMGGIYMSSIEGYDFEFIINKVSLASFL